MRNEAATNSSNRPSRPKPSTGTSRGRLAQTASAYGHHSQQATIKVKDMKKGMTKRHAAAMMAAIAAASAAAQIPAGYYDSLKGKSGAELKAAVHETIKEADVLSYGSGAGHTWDGFYSTDRLADGRAVDRYSNDERYFTTKGQAVSGMNIEHSFPKSWWGGSENQAYKDLYNLMPSEQKINSAKSNYPMGEVTGSVKTDNGCTKVGTGHNGYSLWEPADKWKGDFARSYMYMATAYQDFTWSTKSPQALQILEQNEYPTLQPWAYELYISWAKADVPDEIETNRNNAVSEIQGNRNPFVDFPNLMEYIWGDSTEYAFDPENTVCTAAYTGGGDTPTPPTGDETIYSATFTADDGNCTIHNTTVPYDGFSVWQRDSKYGWKGTGFLNYTDYACDASLLTPEIDLTGYASATLSFSHAANYFASPAEALAVEVVCDGQTTALSGINWPRGNNWTFVESGDISLNEFAGKKIRIAFHYTSTTSEAGTWEVKSVAVKGKKLASGISAAEADKGKFDPSLPYETYTLDGRKATNTQQRGLVIIKQGSKKIKVKN